MSILYRLMGLLYYFLGFIFFVKLSLLSDGTVPLSSVTFLVLLVLVMD